MTTRSKTEQVVAEGMKTEKKWTLPELERIGYSQWTPEMEEAYDALLDAAIERADKLEREVQATATSWQPQPGDRISGVIIAVADRQTDKMVNEGYDPVPVYTVRSQGRKWDVWALHSVLRGELEKQGAAVGSIVAIEYRGRADRGRQRGKGGYAAYVVKVA